MKKILIAALTLSAAAVSTNALADSEEFFSRLSLAERAQIGAEGPVVEAPSFATRSFEASKYQGDELTERRPGDN